MTLEQIRIFVAVAEAEHVTRAARALGIAQSAASTAIAALESHHGVKLFHRIGRGIELTTSGRALLAEARAVLDRVASADRAMAQLAAFERGVLSLMASQTVANYWLPRHLAAFRLANPDALIELAIGNTSQVARAVREGAAELGFVEGAVEDATLAATRVAEDRLVLVVGPEHPWAGRTQVGPGELTATSWVLREPGSGTRSVFEAALARLGVPSGTLSVALELPSNEAVRAAVEAGAGAAVMSATVAAPSLEAELLQLVGLELPERAFSVLRRKDRSRSSAAKALLAMIGAAER